MFQEQGMNPEEVRYNDTLDYFLVNIGVEGTDEGLLRDIGEIGSAEPVDSAVDTDKLRMTVPRLQGTELPDGTVNVIDVMKDAHFRLEVN